MSQFWVALPKRSLLARSKCMPVMKYSWWQSEKKSGEKSVTKQLLKTEMLVQDDSSIYELPIVIKKIHDFESYVLRDPKLNKR